jgi:cupin fold WbuC family metalloprotein
MAQLLTDALFADLVQRAGKSPRRRINHNFHTGPEDNPHRFLNVFLRGSYVAPHRHLHPPKAESFIVLEGWMVVVTFDDAGAVDRGYLLGNGPPPDALPACVDRAQAARGIDLQPGVWHTVAALSDHAVCFEVKPGPWDPATDKEFAPWAPREGDPEAAAYLDRLLA